MPTPVWICGAECNGLLDALATPSGSVDHLGELGAGVSIETTIVAPGGSARSYKVSTSAASTGQFGPGVTAVGTTSATRFKIRFTTLPAAICNLWSAFGVTSINVAGLRYNPTGTQIEAFVTTSTGTTVAGAFVPATGVWYLIDVKTVGPTGTSVTWSVDWQVDGVAQTQAARTTGTSQVVFAYRFGSIASQTTTYYIDDIIISETAADYPIGNGAVVGLYPSGDGTHVYNAVGDFKKNNTTNLVVSPQTSDTWQSLQNPLSLTIGNYMSSVGAATNWAEYLQWTFADLPAQSLQINGLTVVSTHHSEGTNANDQSGRLKDGASTSDVFTRVDWSNTTIAVNGKMYATAPSGGAWTEAKVNALLFEWGESSDQTPVPDIDGVMFEVDYVPFVKPTVVIAPPVAFQRTSYW